MIKSLVMSPVETISSRDNRRLVRVRKVRNGDVADEIFVEGRRLVGELLASDIELVESFVSVGFQDVDLIKRLSNRVSVTEVAGGIFTSIVDTDQSQGIVVIAKRPVLTGKLRNIVIAKRDGSPSLVAFLKEANNPSNLGAIMRTAEAAGARALITSSKSADAYSPKSLRASAGSAFRLKIIENIELHEAINWARDEGLQTIATSPESGIVYTEIDWRKPSLVVFGSEAHGLTDSDLTFVEHAIKIPLAAGVESLNLAVSAGIILFEAKRQNSTVTD